MRTKKYTFLEALELMKKGKKMCMSKGHDHRTGYYFVIESIYFIEHNGDGTIYSKMTGVPLNWIDNKRKWIIKTNYEGLIHHITLKEEEKQEKREREARYERIKNEKTYTIFGWEIKKVRK